MSPPAEAVAAWLSPSGRIVSVLDASAEPTPLVPYRPVRSVSMIVSRSARSRWVLHLAVRATAAWSPGERCWAFGVPGAELDAFLALAAHEGRPARFALLALGGGDRIVPKMAPPPSGLFAAQATAVERAALRVFGRGNERRLLVHVDAPPWRSVATLNALGLVA